MTGDSYKRRSTGRNTYQCGCEWVRTMHGDRLVECTIHKQATVASVRKFDRERKGSKESHHG